MAAAPGRAPPGNRQPPPPLSTDQLDRSGNPAPAGAGNGHLQNPGGNELLPGSFLNGDTVLSPLEDLDFKNRIPGDRSDDGSHMFIGDAGVSPLNSARDQANGQRVGSDDSNLAPPISPLSPTAPASYPGVVAGGGLGFGGVEFDDASMADILNPSAAAQSSSQHGQGNQAAGANIAPWLQEVEPPAAASPTTSRSTPPPRAMSSPAGTPLTSASQSTVDLDSTSQASKSKSHLSHFPSVPTLPRILRHHPSTSTGHEESHAPYAHDSAARSTRSSSASSLVMDGATTPTSHKARSLKNLVIDPSPPPIPERQGSVAPSPHQRFSTRLGSTARGSTSSINQPPADKKKHRFLGGILKRRTGQSISQGPSNSYQPHPDFNPTPSRTTPSRMNSVVSTGGSIGGSYRQSSVSSVGSASTFPGMTPISPVNSTNQRQASFKSEGNVSPLQEVAEPDFQLNMDLDDMEGIVDSNLVNAPRPPTSSVSVSPVAGSEMGLADALHETDAAEDKPATGRQVVEEANPASPDFTRPNPFSQSPGAADAAKVHTPPSPLTMLPRMSTASSSTAPRRPSQLRNVKMSSIDSNASEISTGPMAPSWALGMTPGSTTVFSDPFRQSTSRPIGGEALAMTPADGNLGPHQSGPSEAGGSSISQGSVAPAIAPYNPSIGGAAWEAPESWGVEADEEPTEDGSSSSSSDEEGWVPDSERVATPENRSDSGEATANPSGANTPRKIGSRAHSHHHHHHKKGGLAGARSGAPGKGIEAGSGVPYFTRIYRGDGSFDIMSFPIGITTGELINLLAGGTADKKVTTSMKLYVRERGQDRLMVPSERPLVLQTRRLQQAGYTEAEHIEEIGKEDLSMLCRFIYQTPVLPVMNPDEESSYESFEFIDLSGRDLQIIPIFLHLHADNIIILNVSRNPMNDLPLDFIQACNSLKELRMSNMALKRVPASIRSSTTLARLDLSCNRISDLESAQLVDIETLLSLKVQNNRLSSIPSYFLQMKALKYLNISNNVFDEFPTVVCEMSNLVDLDVSFNQIAELPSEMSDLKSLERLICVGNELEEFPPSFSTLANLRVLDVRRNKLVDLTPVYALPNLAMLRADSNDLVTLDTQLGPKVRDFSVPHNSITRFTLASMPGMTASYSLTHLNLSHGKLSTLDDGALSELVNLVELNLSFNQFTRLPQTLDRLVSLEVFSCTDNMISAVPNGCFGNMQKLKVCNIHNNNLKDIPSDVWLCSSIEVINLSSNLLELLPSPPQAWFDRIDASQRKMSTVSSATDRSDKSRMLPPAGAALQRLYLADNRLTDELFHQVALFSNLKVLNVSFNKIAEIPPRTLSRCGLLEALYLSGNRLTSLPAEDLEHLTNLRVLHVNGNKLQTLPSELGSIPNLEHLDVGSNVLKYNIANWPYDWNWNWNTELRYLNLSGNKRLEIKPTSGQELSHNQQGFRRELSDFNALTHLRVLGLMDVTLRIPSLPDESDEKRVRTSFSDINNMAYGISDMLGSVDHLAMFDLAVPNFRGSANECVFGMFGRAAPSVPSGKIPKFVQEHFATVLAEQLRDLRPDEETTEALRRSFLHINKDTFDSLAGIEKRHRDSTGSFMTGSMRKTNKLHSQMRTGAPGAVVYLVDKTIHVANAGDTLVVISRKGEAELLSKRHDPTEREETARIRRAEAWVSPKGFVNDDKEIEISRAFGFYQALPAVNASPEVGTRQLQESDEFVIIGNSALWKCCSYQTAVDIARTERHDPMMAAQKLRDFAISYGAEGSVMIMVISVSDLFFGRGGRGFGLVGGPADVDVDSAEYIKRAQRRRNEDVGDRTLNRLQQEIEPPTGQVAIVFTDIVNSTALWETNPGMPTAIKMHHSLMRRQLRLDGGYEVKTEGDSFMVSFSSVTAAVLWAFNCQIGLLQMEWPRELLESEDGKVIYDSKGNIIHRGLRVRMGVHWGAPECEKDPITRRMDYYGPMVNRSARINASADGGQLMASQDVLNVIRGLREYIESSDDHTLDDLPPDTKREVQELRRIGGLDIKDMGERKLKGLEVPEKLSLLYPKALSGRLELFTGLRANVEVNEARLFASERSIEEARQLSTIVLRLEALCALQNSGPGDRTGVSSPTIPATDLVSLATARKSISGLPGPPSNRLQPPNPHLGPQIRDSMTEDELVEVVASMTTRIENCLSTLYLKQLGSFTTVLAALEQATRIDPSLVIHALSLMSGAMAQQ